MSKERLEKAKKILNHIKGYGVYDGNDDIEIFEWLIEQAERVEELKDKLARIRFVNNDYDKQNKRYREALEFYADRKTYERRHDPYEPLDTDINDDRGEKARKALEGEE